MADEFNLTEHDIEHDVPEVRTSSGHVITLVAPTPAVSDRRYVMYPEDAALYYTAQPEKKEKY